MNQKRNEYWYQKKNLKHITGFLSATKKNQLKQLVKRTTDLTLTRYVSRLLEEHLRQTAKNVEGATQKAFQKKIGRHEAP